MNFIDDHLIEAAKEWQRSGRSYFRFMVFDDHPPIRSLKAIWRFDKKLYFTTNSDFSKDEFKSFKVCELKKDGNNFIESWAIMAYDCVLEGGADYLMLSTIDVSLVYCISCSSYNIKGQYWLRDEDQDIATAIKTDKRAITKSIKI